MLFAGREVKNFLDKGVGQLQKDPLCDLFEVVVLVDKGMFNQHFKVFFLEDVKFIGRHAQLLLIINQ